MTKTLPDDFPARMIWTGDRFTPEFKDTRCGSCDGAINPDGTCRCSD